MRIMQKDLIQRLGGRCQVCSSTESLQVHHRWYVAEDRGTGGKWKRILELYEKEPGRFSCLCSRCNRLSGHIVNVKNNSAETYERLMEEVSKMAEGRKDSPVSHQILLMRLHNYCVVCNKQIDGRGKTCGKECRDKLDVSRRRKYAPGPRTETCAVCGNEFQYRPRKKTCSDECSKKYRYERHNFARRKYKECVICGKPLTTNGKTCSDKCSTELQRMTSRKNERKRYQPVMLECRECGKTFQRKYGRQLSCSNECKLKWLNRPKVANCVVCGNRFEKRAGNQIACSKDCMSKRLYQAQERSCSICGKTFQRKGHTKTCSGECSGKLRIRNMHETRFKNQRPVVLNCVICGSEFVRRHGVQKTCSEKCKLQYREGQRDAISKKMREKRIIQLQNVEKSKS